MKGKSKNAKIRNATPLEYDGIPFKSKLEVYTYQQLTKFKIEANYEPIKFTIIEPFQYDEEKVRAMTYTPDFVGDDFVIECKGWANDAFPLRWKTFKYFLYMNKIHYKLYLLRNKKEVDAAIVDILKKREEYDRLS